MQSEIEQGEIEQMKRKIEIYEKALRELDEDPFFNPADASDFAGKALKDAEEAVKAMTDPN